MFFKKLKYKNIKTNKSIIKILTNNVLITYFL